MKKMKGFVLFLLGVVVGVGAGYVVFEHNGGLLPGDGSLKLDFADHFLKTLEPGDRVSLREGRYGYSLEILEKSAAEAAEEAAEAAGEAAEAAEEAAEEAVEEAEEAVEEAKEAAEEAKEAAAEAAEEAKEAAGEAAEHAGH